MNRDKWSLGFILVVFLVTRCTFSSKNSSLIVQTDTPVDTRTVTKVAVNTSTLSKTIAPINTATYKSTLDEPSLTISQKPFFITPTYILTLTSAPTQLLTSTPIPASPIPPTLEPTLTFAQSQIFLFELLKNNAGCKLPCWWGITPGITRWEEANRLILHMGVVMKGDPTKNGFTYYGHRFDWADPLTVNNIGFYVEKGLVEGIYVSAESGEDVNFFRTLWRSYSIERVVATYGPPTRVLVGVSWIGDPNSVYARIIIFYDNFKLLLIYHTRALTVDESDLRVFRICPSWSDLTWSSYFNMFILSSTNPLSLEDYIRRISNIPISPGTSIEDAAGISHEEFYERFLPGNGPACFDTPQDMWK